MPKGEISIYPGSVSINGVSLPNAKINGELLKLLQNNMIETNGNWLVYDQVARLGTGTPVISIGNWRDAAGVLLCRSGPWVGMCIQAKVKLKTRPVTELEIADILRGKIAVYDAENMPLGVPDGCDFDSKFLNFSWGDGLYRPLHDCYVRV